MIPRLLKPFRLRPTFLQASLVSLLLHGCVAAAVLAIDAWLLTSVESAAFGGRRTVVQMAMAPAAPPTETFETPPMEFPSCEATESPSHSPSEMAPRPMTPTRRRPDAPPTGKTPAENQDSDVRPYPLDRSRPSEYSSTPPVHQTAHPLPRQTTAVRPPSPAVMAALPSVPGTDDTQPPDFAGNRPPDYPAEAYRRGIQGRVLLRLFIAASGEVERVEVVQSSGDALLDRAAVKAVRTWRGTPAHRGGVAVPTVQQLPVVFRLRD